MWHIFKREGIIEFFKESMWHMLAWLFSIPLSLFIKGSFREIREDIQATLIDFIKTKKVKNKIRSLNKNVILKGIEDINLSKFKKGEKIFLLGCGASVNDLTLKDWEYISNYDSIGWNSWHVHEFVPTYYFFEMGDHDDRYYHFIRLLEEKAEEYTGVSFVCRYKNLYNIPNPFIDLPQKVRDNLYLSAPYYLKGRTRYLIYRLLLIWRKFVFDKPKKNLGQIIHLRGTLSDVVSFSVLAGYREIVLVGIDMNNKRYFWEEDPEKYPHGKGIKNLETGDVHNTVNPDYTNLTQTIPLDEVLDLLDRIVLQPNGIKLWISTRKSKLYPRFPLYPEFQGKRN